MLYCVLCYSPEGVVTGLSKAQDDMLMAQLEVVHVWSPPMSAMAPPLAGVAVAPSPAELEQGRAAAHEALDRQLGEAPTAGLDVERVVETGAPAKVLVGRSEATDVLVVGSRGRGGFASLLLGSVGHQCAHHAACPVVVVR